MDLFTSSYKEESSLNSQTTKYDQVSLTLKHKHEKVVEFLAMQIHTLNFGALSTYQKDSPTVLFSA